MLIVRLTGVVHDGSPHDEAVPTDARKALELFKGQDTSLQLTVFRDDGSRQKVNDATVTLTIKSRPTDSRVVAAFTGWTVAVGDAGGELVRIVTVADMANVPAGRYFYDITSTRFDERNVLVPVSPLIVHYGLTA